MKSSFKLGVLFTTLCLLPIMIVYAAEVVGNIQDLTYTYDAVGNITNITDNSITPTNKSVLYEYDELNRLVGATSSGLANGDYGMTYGYDPIGNMTYKSDVGTMTYDGTGLPTPHAVTDVDGQAYTYDLNGNLTSDGTNTYTWTFHNELESVTTPDGTFAFTYDHTGQRVSMTDPDGEETIYVNPYFEVRPDSRIFNVFAGPTRVASLEVGDGSHPLSALVTYFHQDHLGGTQVASNDSGRATHVYDYLPYGSQNISDDLGQNEANHSFTDKEYHDDMGLYYFEARYYDPVIGRFVSMDPMQLEAPEELIGDPQSFNAYAYSRNNPVNLVDPTGELFRKAWEKIHERWYDEGNYISSYMLRNSLRANPLDMTGELAFNDDSYAVQEIKKSNEYKELLSQIKGYIDQDKLEGTLSDINNNEGFAFESGDLSTSIHGVTSLSWSAEENEDGTYMVNIQMTDDYDFKFDWFPTSKIQLGVTAAAIDQTLGIIENYEIEINIQDTI